MLLHAAAVGAIGLCLGLFFRAAAVLAASVIVAATVGGYSLLDGQTFATAVMRVAGALVILQTAYAAGLLLSALRASKR